MRCVELTFPSGGADCAATLVHATTDELRGPEGRPGVVMAHGFGATRDSGLLPFAERFAAAGVDVLMFDYRGFGTSGGQPRQAVSHRRQRADYHAAVRAMREFADPDRIALWGTSYSGGHVLAVAAQDERVAAVVSQGAAVDGLAVLFKGEPADPDTPRSKGLRMAAAAVRDAVAAALHRTPHAVAAVGGPGEFAMLTDADSAETYLAMMGPSWSNEVCARSLLTVAFNRPVLMAERVRCPTLFVVAERDTIAPPRAVREAARRMRNAEIIAFDCAHFGIYAGWVFERSVAEQVAFLRRTLGPRSRDRLT